MSALVLTRKEGEAVDIGQGAVLVTVASIRGGAVRLRIEAAEKVPILRNELLASDELRARAETRAGGRPAG